MQTITLKTDKLGLTTPITVNQTYRNQELANDMYIYSLKLSLNQTKDLTKFKGDKFTKELIKLGEAEKEIYDKQTHFVKTILGLSEKQLDSIKDNKAPVEITSWINYCVFRFRGLSDEDCENMFDDEDKETAVEGPKDGPGGSGNN